MPPMAGVLNVSARYSQRREMPLSDLASLKLGNSNLYQSIYENGRIILFCQKYNFDLPNDTHVSFDF
jgi:hypothetical protein